MEPNKTIARKIRDVASDIQRLSYCCIDSTVLEDTINTLEMCRTALHQASPKDGVFIIERNVKIPITKKKPKPLKKRSSKSK